MKYLIPSLSLLLSVSANATALNDKILVIAPVAIHGAEKSQISGIMNPRNLNMGSEWDFYLNAEVTIQFDVLKSNGSHYFLERKYEYSSKRLGVKYGQTQKTFSADQYVFVHFKDLVAAIKSELNDKTSTVSVSGITHLEGSVQESFGVYQQSSDVLLGEELSSLATGDAQDLNIENFRVKGEFYYFRVKLK